MTRTYTMRARAVAAEQTRERILEAVHDLALQKPFTAIALPEVAERAGVSVQTILRQFGSRDGLLDATTDFGRAQIVQERRVEPGDRVAAVRNVIDHYERVGDGILMILNQESWDARAKSITDSGKTFHRQWVEAVFAPLLADRPKAERVEALDLLVVATDIYTWKLLRRDRGLSRAATERRVLRLVNSILEG
ncbi:TetR/AcrR family transcriptional regulator [Skermania sp. ID1734]|uniref:TetR/AcrR family transcriptional regulator n=1 Tax=Skermania sp. ID1734 TaxID=2597516 RepID=UPI00163D7EC9|nr:TetR/AcrR family transcriptional regulator [Skermania sp. ID1734]